MVEGAGYPFEPGGEPSEAEVAAIREQLPIVPAAEASVLGNRELFGRLAARAMLPAMQRVFERWRPDAVIREPCEYASAVLAHRTGAPVAQVAISFADVEAGSIALAAPALEEHHSGMGDVLMTTPHMTRFPESLDPSPFSATLRFRETIPSSPDPLPIWWGDAEGPLVYMTFGTVLGHMANAAEVYRMALKAVEHLDARILMAVGRKFDASNAGATAKSRSGRGVGRPAPSARARRPGRDALWIRDGTGRAGGRCPHRGRAPLCRPVREQPPYRR
jgi:hypothetical protein